MMPSPLAVTLLLIFGSIEVVRTFPVDETNRTLGGMKGFRIKPSMHLVLRYCDWPTPYNLSEIQPTFVVQYRGGEQKFTISNDEEIEGMINGLSKDGVIRERVAFVVHGFENDINSPWLYEIASALLAVEDYTVFIIAWGKGADFWINFSQAASNTRIVSAAVATATKTLREASSPYIYCIGHSLGAHICGQAGVVSKLDRISGLDPAGPGFEGCPENPGLSNSSANCVDVVHTNGEWFNGFGTMKPLGHVDFYPNCGRAQPACSFWDMFVGCSHGMAIQYFLASIQVFTNSSTDAKYPSSNGPCTDRLVDDCNNCGWFSCPDTPGRSSCPTETTRVQSFGYGSVCHHDRAPPCCSQEESREKYFGFWHVPVNSDGEFVSFCPAWN